MDPNVFDKFRILIYEKSGITLGPQKVALVSARVGKRMRALNINDHKDYLNVVINDESGDELIHLLDAISTNVTSFFREAPHFEFFTKALEEWRKKGQSRFRIWSAASSTGEEPYTIAMTALESLGSGRLDLRILATDISTRVLQACLRGHYAPNKVEPVSAPLRKRYFSRVNNAKGEEVYAVSEELKSLITFRRLNLATPPYPMKGPMDVVFCRNVMIYFDDTIRRGFVEEAYRLLKPGGYLIIGHSESLVSSKAHFRTMRPSVYQKV